MEGGLFPPGPPRGAPPRGRVSEVDTGGVVPRGPVSDDVLQAINERATAIFSSHKHKVSGMLEAPQGLYALALVGAMLGLNQKQLDSELQMAQKVGRRALSFEDFMTAVEAMVSLHGALAQQQVKRLPNNDMSKALRSAFDMYTKLNVGGFVGGDSRMNSNQFTKMCNDAGMMEPNGPASVSMLQLCWASCKATFGSTRLQYSQFLKILGALAAELSGDVLLLVAGLGLQLPTVPPLRNGFRKPDAGEVNLNVPKPELVQGMGAHMAANDEYEKFVEGGMGRRDPLRANASPIKARSSMNGGAVPNWVKAMQADQGGGSVMTSGQDIRGIPVIETPDSDDDMPKKPQPRKSSMAPQPPADGPQRVAASPMRGPRGGKLPQMGGGGGGSETMSAPMDEYLIKADAPNYGGRGNQIDITESTGPMTVRPRESLRNGPRGDPDSPTINPLEPSILTGAGQRMRKSLIQPEAMQEVVQQQQVAVKALETKVEEQQQREKDLFTRVQLLTEKLQEAQVAAAITVKPGCPGAPLSMPDVPEGKPRTVVSGRCPLTDQVDKLTQQMAEVMARLSALESIRIESKSEGDAKTRNPVAARAPTFDDSGALAPSTGWTPPGMGAARRPNGDEAPALVGALQPANATQGEWMSRLLLNLDKRVRSMEAASGKPDTDKDEEALAEVLRQLQAYEAGRRQPAPPGAAPITPVPGADPFSPAFSMVDHRGRPVPAPAPGAPPVLLPTGDPELDKRLRALADDMRNKNATVGLLLDMFNQTRAEVASLSAQLADMRRAGGAPAPGEPAEAMGMAPSPGGKARNPIKVVDSGFMAPEVHLTAAPARKAAEPGAEAALGPLAPQLENVIAENSSIKMAMRELCAAVGVTPPPLLAAAEPGRAGPTPGAGADAFEMSPWGAPGRRNLKDEAQEVKRNVETVQQDVGELKKVVEQMRAGYGEWPQPLRAPQPGAAPGAAAAQVPDMEPIQAVAAGAGRNPIQVTAGAPLHSVDPMLVPKDRRGLTPLGEPGAVGGLPDAQLGHLMDDLQKLKAFVGLGDAVASMPPLPGAGGAAPGMGPTAGAGAVELGAWADAGRGPRPLKETVQTVAQDVDALRKHVKAMDAALRTNINNTNNMTSFLNTNAPALMAAADAAAKEAEEAKAGGRNPIKVAAGGVEAGGALAPGQKGLLPMQTAGNFEAGVVDPGEYQALRDQVRNMATYLGAPAAATAPGLGAAPGAKPGLEPMAQAAGGPWGAPGRAGSGGAGGYGPGGAAGGTLPEQMENLQKQVAAMGRAMMAAGMDVDSFQGGNAAAAAAAGGNAAAEEMASNVKSRNAIGVVPGMAAVEVQQKFMSPGRGPLATPEGGTAALEPSVSALQDEMRAMKAYLGIEAVPPGIKAAGRIAAPGLEPMQAAGVPGDSWGTSGRSARDFSEVRAGGALGDMARDLDNIKRRQADVEEALRVAGVPVAAGAQGGGGGAGGDGSGAAGGGGGKTRNPIMVASGYVTGPEGDKKGFQGPGRPLQPLGTIEGVPEPVISHLGALQDDVRRMAQFLGMTPAMAAAPALPGGAPGGIAPIAGTEAAAAPVSWGSAPPARAAPKIQNIGDLVNDVENYKARQQGVERVLRSMGAQIPWPEDAPAPAPAAGAAPGDDAAPGESPVAVSRQRNAIAVNAGPVEYGGALAAPAGRGGLAPLASGAGAEALSPVVAAMADDLRRVQAVLGLCPAAAAATAGLPGAGGAPGVSPMAGRDDGVSGNWGVAGRDIPRWPNDQPKNLVEIARDVDDNRKRVAAIIDAMKAANIPIPPALAAEAAGDDSSTPEGAAAAEQRRRNAISVSAGPLQSGGPGAGQFMSPGRKLPGMEGLPEPVQAELAKMADDIRKVHTYLGMNPAVAAAPALAAPAVAAMVPIAAGHDDGVSGSWGVAGREGPRGPGEPPKSMGEVVKELDDNKRRMAAIIDAMKAANIPVPAGVEADGAGAAPGESPVAVSRQRNAIAVSAGPMLPGGPLGAAPGRNLPALEGLPEPAAVEMARMADELKRVQAILANSPAVAATPAAAAALAQAGAPQPGASGDGVSGDWGVGGRPPASGAPEKNVKELIREVDNNKRRIEALENFVRGGGSGMGAGSHGDGSGGDADDKSSPEGGTPEQQQRRRNAVNVTAGGVDGGSPMFAPGRVPASLQGLPEPAQAELAKMADEIKQMKSFMDMGPPARAKGPGADPVQPVMAAVPGGGFDSWGGPGRDPRSAPEAPRNMGEVVKDLDENKRRVAALETAMRAAGIPVPSPDGEAPAAGEAAGEAPAQRKRNPIMVSAGPAMVTPGGFNAPQRALAGAAPEGPAAEPLQPHMGSMADDIRQMKAFLNMGPPVLAPAMPALPGAAPAQGVMPMPGRDDGVSGNWGVAGRPPRQAGEPPRDMGEVVKDVQDNNRRVAAMIDAMKAANIPIPPALAAEAAALPAESPAEVQARKQRNPIMVSAGGVESGPGFAAPSRELKAAMAGLPEPLQAELAKMADDMQRMKIFMNGTPAVAAAPGLAAPAVAAVMPVAGRDDGVSGNWGVAGRPPRQAGEPPRDMGEAMKDVQDNNRRVAAMIDAMKAANIPIPPALAAEAAALPAESPAEVQARKQRNPIMVSGGPMDSQGFTAPAGRQPAMEGVPEPVKAELARLNDDVRRMQAALATVPALAVAPALVAAKAGAGPNAGRDDGVSGNWGVPGRDPRGPGEAPAPSVSDLSRELDRYKERTNALADAMQAAGIPVPPPAAPGEAPPDEGTPEAAARKRNAIAVSPAHYGGPDQQGFAGPGRGAAGAGPDAAPLPARVDNLADELKAMKAFLGMPAEAQAPKLGPDGKPLAPGAEAVEGGPWAGPGRVPIAKAVENVTRDMDNVKDKLKELDRALKAAGMGGQLPREMGGPGGGAGGGPDDRGPEAAAARQRNAVAVMPGLQAPNDPQAFSGVKTREAPPIDNPQFVDGPQYDKLRGDVEKIKALMGPAAVAAVPVPGKEGLAPVPGAAEALGPWANKTIRQAADDTKNAVDGVQADLGDMKKRMADMAEAMKALEGPLRAAAVAGPDDGKGGPGGPGAAAGRNPIAVNAGMVPTGPGSALTGPGRQGGPDGPDGNNPVTVDAEEIRNLKKAVEDLQNTVGQPAPAAAPEAAKKPKTLKEDTDDIKKFVRAMGKDVGAMGNDMQALKKHLDDVEGAMNRALANLAAELAKMKAERDADDEGGPRRDQRKLENAGDSMADTINAMAALNAAQQQQLARAGDGNRNDDIDALNEAMRQSENQLARLLAFLKQDVMDRFAVHEKTLIRMAKQIDYIQRLLKGEFDDQREAARDAGSSLTVSTPEGHTMATYDS